MSEAKRRGLGVKWVGRCVCGSQLSIGQSGLQDAHTVCCLWWEDRGLGGRFICMPVSLFHQATSMGGGGGERILDIGDRKLE